MHLLELSEQEALPDKMYECAQGQDFTAGTSDSLCPCWERPGKVFPGADPEHFHQSQWDKVEVGMGWRGFLSNWDRES